MTRMRLITLLATLALSGCMTVGPDFVKPHTALPPRWASDQPRQTSSGADDWWRQFHDPLLTKLEQQLMRNSLDLQQAEQRVLQTQAQLGMADAQRWPTLTAGGGYQRQRSTEAGSMDPSGNGGRADYNHWTGGFSSSWEPDFWGRVRRSHEAAEAQLAVSDEQRHALQVSLGAELAVHYVNYRAAQALHQATGENIAAATRSLQLTQLRHQFGAATLLDVDQAQTQLDGLKAQLPLLDDQLHQQKNALTLLLGLSPGALDTQLQAGRPLPMIQGAIPLDLPSSLAQRRPDIRQAEASLHAATAAIGVAEADYYPRITLSGDIGYEALQLANMGSWATHTFAIGPAISLPIFAGGRIKNQVRFAEHRQQESALAYQQVVLRAWHEINDALSSLRQQQQREQILRATVTTGEHAHQLAQTQYQSGAASFINVLSTQQELLTLQESQIAAQQASSLAAIALYRALGGGWQSEI